MKLILFLLITIQIITSNSFGQLTPQRLTELLNKGTESEIIFESTELIQNNSFYQAELLVDKLLLFDPLSSNYNFRKGYLLMVYKGNFIEAEKHLEIGAKKISNNYDMISVNEKGASLDVIFYLAHAKHMLGKIDEAEELYNQFKKQSVKNSILISKTDLNLKQCKVARKLLSNPDPNVNIQNLGPKINTSYPEYSAVVSLDGSSLYFTSKRPWHDEDSSLNREFNEDIYVSTLNKNNSWNPIQRLEFCDQTQNEASLSVSADERRIYMYRDQTGGGDIFFSDFSSNQFSIIAGDDRDGVNTNNWETHCSVTLDGKTMYFISDRPGGYGGRDIYRIDRTDDGGWTAPKNLGPTVNTPYDEDGVFIAVDNQTLYFSSNGEKSMGGFDVFVTQQNEKGEWSNPKNLGYPLNTCSDEIYYTTTIDGRKAYLTSLRIDGEGEKDIYEILHNYVGLNNVSYVDGIIKTVDDEPLPEDIAIRFSCSDCKDTTSFMVYPRLRDGNFYATVEPCKEYTMTYVYENGKKIIKSEQFLSKCEKPIAINRKNVLVDLTTMTAVPEKIQEVEIIPVVEFSKLNFTYYFDYNSNKLSTKRGELKKFLTKIEKQLEEGREKITINIYSSASYVPTKKFKNNEELARLRAENIKYDIISYIQRSSKYNGKISIVIVDYRVDGPKYENDPSNKEKYRNFQFIKLETE
jgi:hypothetical protein